MIGRANAVAFGARGDFAIEIGPFTTADLRVVELWAAGIELTCDDCHAFVPQFCRALDRARAQVAAPRPYPRPGLTAEENHRRLRAAEDDEPERHRFLDWGPTTDNLSSFLFADGADVAITFEFWRPLHPRPDELGKIFVVRIARDRLREMLARALEFLTRGV